MIQHYRKYNLNYRPRNINVWSVKCSFNGKWFEFEKPWSGVYVCPHCLEYVKLSDTLPFYPGLGDLQ
jgi:hypothetical protein